MKKEPSVRSLKADLDAANKEAKSYLTEMLHLRERVKQLEHHNGLLSYQLELVRGVLRMEVRP